ncbi:MAG: hypothetical protein M1838_002065 [Thelocarpon superellum]|nr:MAG: hypothetical protein M1838_002065 [Thelocarpon superellum]
MAFTRSTTGSSRPRIFGGHHGTTGTTTTARKPRRGGVTTANSGRARVPATEYSHAGSTTGTGTGTGLFGHRHAHEHEHGAYGREHTTGLGTGAGGGRVVKPTGTTGVHHKRKPSLKDKIEGVGLKIEGKLTGRPGKKAAGTKKIRGTDGKHAHHRGLHREVVV